MKETGVFTSAANARVEMALPSLPSVDTLPERFPWLQQQISSPGSALPPGDLGDELALFADEVLEWAELSLAAGLESWPDDDWSDQ